MWEKVLNVFEKVGQTSIITAIMPLTFVSVK